MQAMRVFSIFRSYNNARIAPACVALFLVGCVHKTGALREQISHYQGDGTIRDVSFAAEPFFSGPGFRIAFAGFDPRKPYEGSYRFKGVPKTKYGESTIYVRFPGDLPPDLDAKKNVTSVLSFSILDQKGALLKSQKFVFNSVVWSWQQSATSGLFGLWIQGDAYGAKNRFYFEPAKEYQLQFTYAPGATPPQTTNMYLTIENGGRM
jgi:hypothetical protein